MSCLGFSKASVGISSLITILSTWRKDVKTILYSSIQYCIFCQSTYAKFIINPFIISTKGSQCSNNVMKCLSDSGKYQSK